MSHRINLAAFVAVTLANQLVSIGQEPSAPASHARIEVIAESEGVQLNDAKWIASQDSYAARMNRLPVTRQPASCYGEFGVEHFAAPDNVIRFVPSGDTDLRVKLGGPWRDRGDGRPAKRMVDWRRFNVSGAQLIGPALKPRAAWVDDPIELKLAARAHVPVYISVAASSPPPAELRSTSRQTSHAHQLAEKLKHGVNLANWLEVPPGEDWGDNSCDISDYKNISRAGFDHVRVPIGWHHYTGPAHEFTIQPEMFNRVDRVVDQVTESGLAVILNIHHFHELTREPDANRTKLLAIWRQLSEHFAGRPDSVFFEILNEPTDKATTGWMNDVYAELLPVIRQTNPDRGVLVGPGNFNSVFELSKLKLPQKDTSLIVTVHSYDPFLFTHQGATWSSPEVRSLKGIRFPGPPPTAVNVSNEAAPWVSDWVALYNQVTDSRFNPSGVLTIERAMDVAAGWSQFYGRPLHLGEFGAFTTADDISRANYYAAVRRAAESRDIGWCVWDWKAGFAFWDRKTGTPKAGMQKALFGPAN